MVRHISSEQEFNEVVSNGFTVVDFYAEWCGPCKMLSPTIDELSEEVNGINFVKVNVDEVVDVAIKYGVEVIPTLIFFNNGKKVDRTVGLQSKEQIKQIIKRNI